MIIKTLLLSIFCGLTAAFAPFQRNKPRPTTHLDMSPYQLDPSVTSFVFIEYQNEFTTPGGKLHDAVKDCMAANNMLANSNKVLQAARQAGCTIIHCPISFEPGHHEISESPYGKSNSRLKQFDSIVSKSSLSLTKLFACLRAQVFSRELRKAVPLRMEHGAPKFATK